MKANEMQFKYSICASYYICLNVVAAERIVTNPDCDTIMA